MTMSLRHRFFLATLAASALVAGVFLLVTTLLVTPRLARRLVEQDARIRLMTLAQSMPEGDGPAKDAYLRRSDSPGWQGVELIPRLETAPLAGQELVVTVPIEDTTLALSLHPAVSMATALSVANPSPSLLAAAALGFLAFVYALTWGLSRFVTRPMLELQAAVTALSEGKRNVSVVLPKEQELAQLAASFNGMAQRLRAREEEVEKASVQLADSNGQLADANRQLAQALQDKERIFANTSHELRTPLTVILGYAQMLQDGLKGQLSPEQAQSMSVIERNARVLLDQVEDLLTLSRLKAGQLPLNEESVDLKDLVDEVVSQLRPLYGKQPLQVSWAREGAFPANLDYERGRQILTNLLENARRYAEGAAVSVRLGETDQNSEIEVHDQGPGIPAELAENLFVEFERGPGGEGSGLGLALARGLAQRFGGDLELRGASPGATFVWTIPKALG